MSTRQTVISAIREHGPMSIPQLRERLPSIDALSTVCAQLVCAGKLRRAGKARSAVYSIGNGSAPAKPKATRPAKSAAPRLKGNGAFAAMLTSDRCIALYRGGELEVFSDEHTMAIADLVLNNFETE